MHTRAAANDATNTYPAAELSMPLTPTGCSACCSCKLQLLGNNQAELQVAVAADAVILDCGPHFYREPVLHSTSHLEAPVDISTAEGCVYVLLVHKSHCQLWRHLAAAQQDMHKRTAVVKQPIPSCVLQAY
jgi:hypothetical protein